MPTTVFTKRSAWPFVSLWPGVVNNFWTLNNRAVSSRISLV